jgi:hypothetical protein
MAQVDQAARVAREGACSVVATVRIWSTEIAMSCSMMTSSSVFTATDPSQRVSKIFVGGLAPEVTDASFREYFSQFGTITDSTVRDDVIGVFLS